MPDFKKDYYKALGITEDATIEQIKQSFHDLAFKFHPDRPGGDEKKFKEINEAYQTLSNTESRAQYDNMRKFGGSTGGFGGNSSGFNWNNANFGNAGDFGGFSGFNDIFESFFGQSYNSQRNSQARNPNEDLEIRVDISLKDSYLGVAKDISFKRFNICGKCDGSGHPKDANINTCKTCSGRGYIEKKRTIPLFGTINEQVVCSACKGEGKTADKKCSSCNASGYISEVVSKKIEIPSGIRNGDVLELKNYGHHQDKKYSAGNLYIKVGVKADKDFYREGDNLCYNLDINFVEAALGSKKEIKNIDDKILIVDIPKGIETNAVLKIKNKGFKRLNQNYTGDLLIAIKVSTPKKLSRNAEELLKKLEKEL